MNKLISRILVSLAFIVIIASAATPLTAFASTYPQTIQGNVIKIGMTAELTGKFSVEGKQALCGVEAAIDYFNNNGGIQVNGKTYKLQLVYYDDQSDKSQVTSLYSRLITTDKVDFLLAPYSSGLTAAAAPLAEQYKKVMLSHGGASDAIFGQGYKYIAQILAPASKYFATSLEMLKDYQSQIGSVKIAFIYEDNAFASAVMRGASQEAKKLGLDVVYNNSYEPGTTDYSSFITSAMAKGANVLIGGGHFADGEALVKQAHDLGWHLKFIGILVAPAEQQFYTDLGDVANGVAYPSQWDISTNFNPDYAKKVGLTWFGPTKDQWLTYFKQHCPNLEPSYHSAEAGAAIVFLVKAIETANSLDSTAVRQAMNSLDLITFFGHLKIDPQTGLEIGHQIVVVQWQNGKQVVVYPKDVATAQPLFMASAWWPASTSTATSSTAQKKSNTALLWTTVIVIIIIIIAAAWYAMKK
ncbi:MAG: amino acid ABC transporter substrate-binding protein [Desulfurococcales archaeon]|nr:amino acid ABC transporter substrate-binding protein [Desulfurococcales archaeon]